MQDQLVRNFPRQGQDVFDVLLVLAMNIKILLTVPLVAGLLAMAVTYALPRNYTSTAIVALHVSPTATITPHQAASIMASPVVLDPVVDSLRLTPDLPRDVARDRLAQRVKTGVGKDLLVRLEVTGPTPAQAQQTANAILSSWLKSTVPSEREKDILKKKLTYASAALAHVQLALKQLVIENPDAAGSLLVRNGGLPLVAIGELGDRYLEQVLLIPQHMEGLPPDVIKQMPTLPTEPVQRRKGLIAIVVALAADAALLASIFLRRMFEVAMQDARTAEKVRRLRQALPRIGRKNQRPADE